MNNRHTFPRKAPPNQRLPDSKGWGREQDGGVTIWNLWAPTNDRLRIVEPLKGHKAAATISRERS